MSGKVTVIGGGLAGLMSVIKLAERGQKVDLFSLVPCKRSHSVCAQGGINAAVNTKGEGDSTWEHFDDTIYGGDFLANQTPVKNMIEAAPSIIYLVDRMGVQFNRTPEGFLDVRRLGGAKYSRTVFAGATTGQQLIYALDEQVRRYEDEGLVTRYEEWELLSLVRDDEGCCRGVVVQDMKSLDIQVFPADAVILATGGPGMIYVRSTNSTINTGFAAASAYMQGAIYANGEFVQIHPSAIPGRDKLRLMSESIRGDGGRVWVYKDGKPWYFLEDWYPAYGNMVPRDIATRAIFKVCVDMKLGVEGENKVYLDITHLDPHDIDRKLAGVVDIYEKFIGDDPRKVPMETFPAVHYSMGGLWVDYNQMTNIPGLFAAGECEYQYHGANRLGGNSLVAAIYAGMVVGPKAFEYSNGLKQRCNDLPGSLFERAKEEEITKQKALFAMQGKENPYKLHQELGEWMVDNVTVVRNNDRLLATDQKIQELMERYKTIGVGNSPEWGNQIVPFTRRLWGMLSLARVITLGAYHRNESRGAHYKPDFPDRDDENWLKTTKAEWTANGPHFSYDPVDTSFIKPRKRRYDVAKEVTAQNG
ncbi:MAG TPA: succinate dehydrogenase flavoprotein subunit [Desulfosporosinus sp.]|nr:succinate dehydrogenase flavoprotein subunit [Desulfosporosinus sp.]